MVKLFSFEYQTIGENFMLTHISIYGYIHSIYGYMDKAIRECASSCRTMTPLILGVLSHITFIYLKEGYRYDYVVYLHACQDNINELITEQ